MDLWIHDLSKCTTQELLGEVMRRTASDGPALQALQTAVIRARLAEGDRRSAFEIPSELVSSPEWAGVAGTMELGLEN